MSDLSPLLVFYVSALLYARAYQVDRLIGWLGLSLWQGDRSRILEIKITSNSKNKLKQTNTKEGQDDLLRRQRSFRIYGTCSEKI